MVQPAGKPWITDPCKNKAAPAHHYPNGNYLTVTEYLVCPSLCNKGTDEYGTVKGLC